jgi:hypothetical protein
MLVEAMLQFLDRGPCSSGAPNSNNRLPPKLPRPPVPPNDGVEPMQECNPNLGTGSQEGSDSEDPEGSSDEKEVSEHVEYDGQVPEDDVVDEDPLEEGEVEGTPSAAGSGPPEDNLDFAPTNDTLGDPEVESWCRRSPRRPRRTRKYPTRKWTSLRPQQRSKILGERGKVRRSQPRLQRMMTQRACPQKSCGVLPQILCWSLEMGRAPYPWQRRVQVLRGRRKRTERKGSQKSRSYILAMMGCRMFKPKFLLRDPVEYQNRR